MLKESDTMFLLFFCAVVVQVIAMAAWGVRKVSGARAAGVFVAGLVVWLGLLGMGTGWVGEQLMPRMFFFMLACNGAALAVALSPLGGKLAAGLTLAQLVTFQGFRFPLEIVLHAWVGQGVIPETMTWTGQNWDIVTGVLAFVLGRTAGSRPAVAWLVNGVGVALLLNVMRVAVMSSPVPFGWGVQPPLMLAVGVPYYLIVPVCVSGALAGHVVLTRALLSRRPV